jgi:hypothetical protein
MQVELPILFARDFARRLVLEVTRGGQTFTNRLAGKTSRKRVYASRWAQIYDDSLTIYEISPKRPDSTQSRIAELRTKVLLKVHESKIFTGRFTDPPLDAFSPADPGLWLRNQICDFSLKNGYLRALLPLPLIVGLPRFPIPHSSHVQ